MSTTTLTKHRAKAVQDKSGIPGWKSTCTCGWKGPKHWATFARARAQEDAYTHQMDMEDAEVNK